MNLPQYCLASRFVEVVQEVRQQHEVVAGAILDVKSAAFDCAVAVCDSCFLSILFRDFKDGFPIERGYFCLRVVLCESDTEKTVTSGDVENPQLAITLR